MSFNYSPKIVTDGLVLYLDAANTKSYVSGSTTWNDLSRGGNNGTLVNGPTFNSSNGGSIVFDGTNDYVNCGPILNYTTSNFTFSTWIYVNSLTTSTINQGPILLWKGNFNTNGYYAQIETNGNIIFVTNSPTSVVTISSISITTGNTYNIVFTRSGSSIKIYVNSVDVTLTAGVHNNPTTNNNNFIISSYGGIQIYSNYRLFNFLNYNRALSAQEILQNYNATKGRFGL